MASPTQIVDAIDTAILTFATNGGSAELDIPGVGRRKFTDLNQLKEVREYYAGLVSAADAARTLGRAPLNMVKLRPGRAT